MSFTYDLSSSNATRLAISKVRLELGDTIEDTGVRANGANLQDEEIQVWLDAESNNIMLTVARACEMLSRDWARMADFSLGQRRESLSQAAKAWKDRADQIREQYGYGETTAGISSGYYAHYGEQIHDAENAYYEDQADDGE